MTNATRNRCYIHSSFGFYAIDNDETNDLNFSKKDCFISYCTIADGSSINRCILFCRSKQSASDCNFVNNTQKGKSEGILANHQNAYTSIIKCCFIGNGKFESQINLFYVQSGTLEVNDCTIDYISKSGENITLSNIIFFYKYPNNCFMPLLLKFKEPKCRCTVNVIWFSPSVVVSNFLIYN
jgi:hypothetical protein